ESPRIHDKRIAFHLGIVKHRRERRRGMPSCMRERQLTANRIIANSCWLERWLTPGPIITMVAMQEFSERPRINWRIAIACAAILVMVFSTANTAILGGAAARETFRSTLFSQALMWGYWLLLLPLVFAIGARAHARGLRDT